MFVSMRFRIPSFLLFLAIIASNALLAGTPAQDIKANSVATIRFQPDMVGASNGIFISNGSAYTQELGYGWDQDMRPHSRKRDEVSSGIAIMDRAISKASFTVDLPDGDYLLEVTSFDTAYPGGLVILNGNDIAAEPKGYSVGEKVTEDVAATTKNGKVVLTFIGGRDGYPNSLVSSIKISPASANPAKWQSAKLAAETARNRPNEIAAKNETKRAAQRSTYKPFILRDNKAARQSFDLSGDWLFMPLQSLAGTSAPDPLSSDTSWHTLAVPQFWRPIAWWIYQPGDGTSHNYYRQEVRRCDDFTFDYRSTNAGWYRQWIDVPDSMRGKRLVLKFDAVGSLAQVFWNGKQVGAHMGMFGQFECEVTPNVKYGTKNLLTVFVAAGILDQNALKQVASAKLPIAVTSDTLNLLPHGWYGPGLPGIWQPVHLEVTGQERISDVYFQPRLDGAKIETTIDGKSGESVQIRHEIIDTASGKALYRDPVARNVKTGKGNTVDLAEIKGLKPKLWSPEHPNLYKLRTQIIAGGKIVDENTITVGFKTFEARGNRLYLNGKPYFLRGSNQPPHGLAPNDKTLADKFMKLMHDGNLMETRFHIGPPSKIWMDAADKSGVGSSVGENWPWVLQGSTPIPDRKLIKIWKNEFMELVQANRNHPSLLMWTISNESYFEHDTDQARCLEKYKIFSDVIKGVRALNPATPIVFHSGHVRDPKQYAELLKPNGIDDGDIDDAHRYYGWYERSPFHLDISSIEKGYGYWNTDGDREREKINRPLVSQEASTGYPDNDTGHPVEKYIRDFIVPQIWVGQYAKYDARPDMFLETHAQITKEMAEKIRRQRTYLSGWGIFATTCWFKDVYNADFISPYPVYFEVKKAWQPVLVSIDNENRHFEAGQTFKSNVFVMNDDPDKPNITNLTLRWWIYAQSDDMGTSGSITLPDCRYDSKCKAEVTFKLPEKLPLDRSNVRLYLELRSGDKVVSKNDYPLVCTKQDFCSAGGKSVIVLESRDKTSKYIQGVGCKISSVKSIDWAAADPKACVVVASDIDKAGIGSAEAFKGFLDKGGRVIMLGTDADIDKVDTRLAVVPGLPIDQFKIVKAEGDFADVYAPELLAGMDPMDMHWWNAEPGDFVRVCRAAYRLPDTTGVKKLVQYVQPHSYISRPDIPNQISWPVVEVDQGKGKVVIDSMSLASDPLAKRFMLNLINYTMTE